MDKYNVRAGLYFLELSQAPPAVLKNRAICGRERAGGLVSHSMGPCPELGVAECPFTCDKMSETTALNTHGFMRTQIDTQAHPLNVVGRVEKMGIDGVQAIKR
jgi:hypothetical protein